MNPWVLARLVKGQLLLIRGQRDALYELVARAEESLARHEPTTAARRRDSDVQPAQGEGPPGGNA